MASRLMVSIYAAALAAATALPAAAQTTTTPPAAPSGTAAPAAKPAMPAAKPAAPMGNKSMQHAQSGTPASKAMPAKHARARHAARPMKGGSSADNSADQLNAESLQMSQKGMNVGSQPIGPTNQ